MSVTRQSIKSLSSVLPEHFDVFVCSVSYEDRSVRIPTQISPDQTSGVIIYADEAVCGSRATQNRTKLTARFGTKSKFVPVDITNPLFTADNMQDSIRDLQNYPVTYVVDITTFTHETLLIFLRLLQNQANVSSTRLIAVYNLASEYSLGNLLHEKWLTKGVKEVRSILGYPGTILPTRKVHLIVLAGLETERAIKVIEMCEPTLLSVGWGEPHASVRNVDLATFETFHRRLVGMYKGVSQFRFSCLDPIITKKSIEERIAASPDHNVVIAPLNTKVSTVGVALAAFENDRVQLCYAPVEQYNQESYSSPSDDCFVFDIPLFSAAVGSPGNSSAHVSR
jgi:hypothetical protein